MKYCSKCLIPDTRPEVTFDEKGVCMACNTHEGRKNIDWEARKAEFIELTEKIKKPGRGNCRFPVVLSASMQPMPVSLPSVTAVGLVVSAMPKQYQQAFHNYPGRCSDCPDCLETPAHCRRRNAAPRDDSRGPLAG